jgi:hypothetical protein
MSETVAQIDNFERYLWNELEAAEYLSLESLRNTQIGSLFWATSGNLEEAVVYVGDEKFIGLRYECRYDRITSQTSRIKQIENFQIGSEYHNDSTELGYVRPYASLDQTVPLDAPTDKLQHQLMKINIEVYEEKMNWLNMLARRIHAADSPDFQSFYTIMHHRLERLKRHRMFS